MLRLTTFNPGNPAVAAKVVNLRLYVWLGDGNEVVFVYGPNSSVDFGDSSATQRLNIELFSDEKLLGGAPRFHISHFTADTLSKITSVSHRDWNGTDVPNHIKEQSALSSPAKSISFDMSMNKGDSFYINIIITDKENGNKRLISCDPQVENGTRT